MHLPLTQRNWWAAQASSGNFVAAVDDDEDDDSVAGVVVVVGCTTTLPGGYVVIATIFDAAGCRGVVLEENRLFVRFSRVEENLNLFSESLVIIISLLSRKFTGKKTKKKFFFNLNFISS